ncbi:MAG: hypothetical protein AVDCRST_MAG19-2916 [uncultured Thermomicrobiales bacterium]|uniref:Uncharacterized protein n=1 Tax=uncultured Thermomicrobiales bacterium TaxID=1645740 RepID=A0A6J4V9N3_9BACT|nr:MAG: hypothetical protein AVDCRST_MAG19-2916 [uncultured Thermomicrobiales bacterium]
MKPLRRRGEPAQPFARLAGGGGAHRRGGGLRPRPSLPLARPGRAGG